MKFSTAYGIGEIQGDRNLARYYYHIALQGAEIVDVYPVEGLDTHDELVEQ